MFKPKKEASGSENKKEGEWLEMVRHAEEQGGLPATAEPSVHRDSLLTYSLFSCKNIMWIKVDDILSSIPSLTEFLPLYYKSPYYISPSASAWRIVLNPQGVN